MKKLFFVLMILLAFVPTGLTYAQQITPTEPESSELITPLNAQPIPIETVTRMRGLLMGNPAKNLIIFATSGLSGASAALGDAYFGKKRTAVNWQGFQLVHPVWADLQKKGRNNLISSLSRVGKKLGLITDYNFYIPGLIEGINASKSADLNRFNIALSFSDQQDYAARAALIKAANIGFQEDLDFPPTLDFPTALDFPALEKLFSKRIPRIIGCFAEQTTPLPGFPELVSSAVDRLALAPEGFCLIVNFSQAARSRNQNHFFQMIESMRVGEKVLHQLATFVVGRKDTLLLVIDEPECGIWKCGETFSTEKFIKNLKKIPDVINELSTADSNTGKILKKYFNGIEFEPEEIRAAIEATDFKKATALIETAISRNYSIIFSAFNAESSGSGPAVLAYGQNADVFFGITSFSEFYKRLGSAIGLTPGE